MIDDPVRQPPGLALPRRGDDERLVFHPGDDPAAQVRPAEPDRVAGHRQDQPCPPGQGRAGAAADADRAQPGPAHREFDDVRVAGAGPQVQADPPAEHPDPVTGTTGVPDDEPDREGEEQQHAERDQQPGPVVNQPFGRMADRRAGRVVTQSPALVLPQLSGAVVTMLYGPGLAQMSARVVMSHHATASALGPVSGRGRGPAGGFVARYLASSRRAVPGW